MPTSPDTLLRLIRRAPLPPPSPARILGLDDWALRKGRTYGSILVDLESHCVCDVLPDRSAPTVSAWLHRHPGVKVIARDRSTEYARAAVLGAPQAQQVADRWHLLLNGRQMLERWMTGAHPRLRALPTVSSEEAPQHAVTSASHALTAKLAPERKAEPGMSLHTKPYGNCQATGTFDPLTSLKLTPLLRAGLTVP
jgi:transposase